MLAAPFVAGPYLLPAAQGAGSTAAMAGDTSGFAGATAPETAAESFAGSSGIASTAPEALTGATAAGAPTTAAATVAPDIAAPAMVNTGTMAGEGLTSEGVAQGAGVGVNEFGGGYTTAEGAGAGGLPDLAVPPGAAPEAVAGAPASPGFFSNPWVQYGLVSGGIAGVGGALTAQQTARMQQERDRQQAQLLIDAENARIARIQAGSAGGRGVNLGIKPGTAPITYRNGVPVYANGIINRNM